MLLQTISITQALGVSPKWSSLSPSSPVELNSPTMSSSHLNAVPSIGDYRYLQPQGRDFVVTDPDDSSVRVFYSRDQLKACLEFSLKLRTAERRNLPPMPGGYDYLSTTLDMEPYIPTRLTGYDIQTRSAIRGLYPEPDPRLLFGDEGDEQIFTRSQTESVHKMLWQAAENQVRIREIVSERREKRRQSGHHLPNPGSHRRRGNDSANPKRRRRGKRSGDRDDSYDSLSPRHGRTRSPSPSGSQLPGGTPNGQYEREEQYAEYPEQEVATAEVPAHTGEDMEQDMAAAM
ncbi:hypothetical protein HYDPIDRAFT_116749 [Hydnomerulius pinastri MD-312]|uniref:Uncharacterized protein n=1 Tax=Hydnomerulius pinastri MD-312 TaxID=994086 RepID=A0A0C9V5N8_9AGAM|nr:hypothetical protein HYDPIDRAFT_116749 [Hydnomerulius pinastri MD-312]